MFDQSFLDAFETRAWNECRRRLRDLSGTTRIDARDLAMQGDDAYRN
jgi:hypothetical protein